MEHFQSWSDLVNPEFYIKLGGYWLVLFIIFAETGLFIGFFLPGDSLLFISGIYAVPMVRDTFGFTGSDLLDTTIIASCSIYCYYFIVPPTTFGHPYVCIFFLCTFMFQNIF